MALTFLGLPKSSSVVSGRISVTKPAAMVFPPSLKANLDPLVIVIGKFSLARIVRLSPGLAIFTFSGRQISAAVSAVLKYSCGLYPELKGLILPPSSVFRT